MQVPSPERKNADLCRLYGSNQAACQSPLHQSVLSGLCNGLIRVRVDAVFSSGSVVSVIRLRSNGTVCVSICEEQSQHEIVSKDAGDQALFIHHHGSLI